MDNSRQRKVFISIVLLILVVAATLGSGCTYLTIMGCKDEYNKCTEKCTGVIGSYEREQCIQKCIYQYNECKQNEKK